MNLFKRIPSITLKDVPKSSTIIDVREAHEYTKHKQYSCINVPLSRIDTYSSNKDVYVICASGIRSKKAVKYLRKKGINAINIKGGWLRNERN